MLSLYMMKYGRILDWIIIVVAKLHDPMGFDWGWNVKVFFYFYPPHFQALSSFLLNLDTQLGCFPGDKYVRTLGLGKHCVVLYSGWRKCIPLETLDNNALNKVGVFAILKNFRWVLAETTFPAFPKFWQFIQWSWIKCLKSVCMECRFLWCFKCIHRRRISSTTTALCQPASCSPLRLSIFIITYSLPSSLFSCRVVELRFATEKMNQTFIVSSILLGM